MLPGGIKTMFMRSVAKISSWEIDCVELSPAVTLAGGAYVIAVFSLIAFRSRSYFSTVLCIFSYDVCIASNESFKVSCILVAMSS